MLLVAILFVSVTIRLLHLNTFDNVGHAFGGIGIWLEYRKVMADGLVLRPLLNLIRAHPLFNIL